MWCAVCLKLVDDPNNHTECMKMLWWDMSTEYSKVKIQFVNDDVVNDDVPKGETVEIKNVWI